MAHALSLLLVGHGLTAARAVTPLPAAMSGYRGFSCDTHNGTIGGNVVSAVPCATKRGKACPDGAGPDVDPLGPCMPNASEVKLALDVLPAGSRALTLEAGPGIYYLFDKNKTAKRWGGMGADYYMDTLPGKAQVQGPWADVYKVAMKKRVSAWFGELKRLGGKLDLVMGDFEMGYHSSSYNWAHQPTADGSDPVDTLIADPRWPALRKQLDEVGKPYGVTFDSASMKTMANWHQQDWRMTVWGRVIPTLYVAGFLNASLFEPIRSVFPAVHFSNFAHWHHADPSAPPSKGQPPWPYSTVAIGDGAHVGTHQSRGFYGGGNSSRLFAMQTPGPEGRQTELAASSFNALLREIMTARDMHRAQPTVPIHPWLAPKHGEWGKGATWLATDGGDLVGTMWEENVFHLALSTGTTTFLWWQPGAERPVGIDLPHLSTVLKELDWVTGIIGGKGEGGTAKDDCTVTPIETNQTMIVDWAPTALLSGATVRCVDKQVRSFV